MNLISIIILALISQCSRDRNPKDLREDTAEADPQDIEAQNAEDALSINDKFKPSHQFVEQYNWAALTSVSLPLISSSRAPSTSTTLALTGDAASSTPINSCRVSFDAVTFLNSYHEATSRVIKEPELVGCDGKPIEVGRIYAEAYGGSNPLASGDSPAANAVYSDSAAKNQLAQNLALMAGQRIGERLYRFIEKGGVLYQLSCLRDSRKVVAVTGFQLVDSQKVKVESWNMPGENETNYSLFSRYVDNPSLIEVKHRGSYGGNEQSFLAEFSDRGFGNSSALIKSDGRSMWRRTIFTNEGGVSQSRTANDAAGDSVDRATTLYFDRSLHDVSRFAIASELYENTKLLDDAPMTDLPEIPDLDPDLHCLGSIDVVSCSNRPTGVSADANTDNAGSDRCEQRHVPRDEDQNLYPPKHFRSEEERYEDEWAYMAVSIEPGKDNHPAVGEVFGLRAYIVNPDDSKTAINARVELELTPGLEQVEPDCSDVGEPLAPATGIAFYHQQVCALAKEWPVLLRALEKRAEPEIIRMRGRDLESSMTVQVQQKKPYRLLLKNALEEEVSAESCQTQDELALVDGVLTRKSKLNRASNEFLLASDFCSGNLCFPDMGIRVYTCYTDGSMDINYRLPMTYKVGADSQTIGSGPLMDRKLFVIGNDGPASPNEIIINYAPDANGFVPFVDRYVFTRSYLRRVNSYSSGGGGGER